MTIHMSASRHPGRRAVAGGMRHTREALAFMTPDAKYEAALTEVERYETLAEAARWYVECFRNICAGDSVSGLAEARAGLDAAVAGLDSPDKDTA